MLASSTTLFNKDFGTLKRDGCLFYRQLRDNGYGSLILFPNDIKQRMNREKFIRDQVAFNLVILACSQVEELTLDFEEFQTKTKKKARPPPPQNNQQNEGNQHEARVPEQNKDEESEEVVAQRGNKGNMNFRKISLKEEIEML